MSKFKLTKWVYWNIIIWHCTFSAAYLTSSFTFVIELKNYSCSIWNQHRLLRSNWWGQLQLNPPTPPPSPLLSVFILPLERQELSVLCQNSHDKDQFDCLIRLPAILGYRALIYIISNIQIILYMWQPLLKIRDYFCLSILHPLVMVKLLLICAFHFISHEN